MFFGSIASFYAIFLFILLDLAIRHVSNENDSMTSKTTIEKQFTWVSSKSSTGYSLNCFPVRKTYLSKAILRHDLFYVVLLDEYCFINSFCAILPIW